MGKPDPYGDWVLFGSEHGEAGSAGEIDEELLIAAREAWPHMLAHARFELSGKEFGRERTALAAEVWDEVLRSVARTRQRNKNHRPPVSDLQSYLIGAFHHRFNRLLKREQRRLETIELVSSDADLERVKSALDTTWAEEFEKAITVRQIASHMDGWTRKALRARQYGYSWREIAAWSGQSEQSAKKKFEYGLEKTRQRIVRFLKGRKTKGTRESQSDVSSS
jgi:DNA-directed RNA polymerase specialized sigma24 family protein